VAISLTPEKLLKISSEITAWGAERFPGSVLKDHQAASLIADESDFQELFQQIKNIPEATDPAIDDAQLTVAIAVLSLRPEDRSPQCRDTFVDFQEVYSVVESEVLDKGLGDQLLLSRDVVIAWGNGWHRANFDDRSDGPDGRWIKAVLALTNLMEGAVRSTFRLLSNCVDKMFTPETTDRDSPGSDNMIQAYASMLTLSAAAGCCGCESNKCDVKHRLSNWSSQTPDGKPFLLRAFATQMARGNAGPRFLNKEFQNSALYPILRDEYGLCFDRVEFKRCHECERQYEGDKCSCGTAVDPTKTKHFIFENAFWIKHHKLYRRRRRQKCAECENLYSLKQFNACPLCGASPKQSRESQPYVLEQRLDPRAVLQPDFSANESQIDDTGSASDVDSNGPRITSEKTRDSLASDDPDVFEHEDPLPDLVHRLVTAGQKSHFLTDSEASEINRRVQAGTFKLAEIQNLAARTALGTLYEAAQSFAGISSGLSAEIEDLVFQKNGAHGELEAKIVAAKAKFLAERARAAGVMTPAMEQQFLTSAMRSRRLESLEHWAGLADVVEAAQLVMKAKDFSLLSGAHANQCLNQALRGYDSPDEIQDNSVAIEAYILANLGRRLGVIEKSEAWSIQDDADIQLINNRTLSELKSRIEARLEEQVSRAKR